MKVVQLTLTLPDEDVIKVLNRLRDQVYVATITNNPIDEPIDLGIEDIVGETK